MSFWIAAAFAYQAFVVVYFAALNLLYAFFGYLGLRSIVVNARELSDVTLKDLLEREVYKPVSILVPAYNEQEGIVASVRSFLTLRYPEFEVIVICDGSTDETLDRLIEEFALTEHEQIWRQVLPSRPVARVMRSLRYPQLVVIDKENGGKADALNAGLNFAQFPLVCSVDADSLLDAEAILRASRLFVEDPTLIAAGGTVRPLNSAVVEEGRVVDVRLPSRWIERFQILEYARAFFTGRAGWSQLNALLIISGAFGIFKRNALLDAGGYLVGTVGEDVELVVRLHKLYKKEGRPYRMVFIPDPICWTEVPTDLTTLRRQRNRWHRGLWETLWLHRDMLFNRKYGRLGTMAVPYFWIFEGLAPVVEVMGFVFLIVSIFGGFLYPYFAILFLVLSVLYGMMLSQLASGIESFLLSRYPRLSDKLLLLLAAFLEFFGYRQLLTIERFLAFFQVWRKRGHWGTMKRRVVTQAAPTKAR